MTDCLSRQVVGIFHICSDYARQALYQQLLRALARHPVRQFMYVPVRTFAEVGVGRIEDDSSIAFRFEHVLRPYHRVFFRTKIRRTLCDVSAHTPVSEYELIHAHFLYSDGALALQLKRKFNRPFIVNVRNTDLNYFMRYRLDLAGTRDEILREASNVVFLSPAYRDAFLARLRNPMAAVVRDKAVVIPNGLHEDWFTNDQSDDREAGSPLRLLYAGDFTQNKNVAGIISALELIRKQLPATLTIVGGGGDKNEATAQLIESSRASGVTYLGRIQDRNRLRSIYREHDIFVMPSFRETFGLTYLEALSQGLPIVHSIGQGVDGHFEPGTVAAAVDPDKPASIASGVLELVSRLPTIRRTCRREVARFSWDAVADAYFRKYEQMLCKQL